MTAFLPILNWFATAIGAATIGSWFVAQDTSTSQAVPERLTFWMWLQRRSMTMKVIIGVAFSVLLYFLYKKVKK
jgi:ABC-type uncharacterized transport system permease subunit